MRSIFCCLTAVTVEIKEWVKATAAEHGDKMPLAPKNVMKGFGHLFVSISFGSGKY